MSFVIDNDSIQTLKYNSSLCYWLFCIENGFWNTIFESSLNYITLFWQRSNIEIYVDRILTIKDPHYFWCTFGHLTFWLCRRIIKGFYYLFLSMPIPFNASGPNGYIDDLICFLMPRPEYFLRTIHQDGCWFPESLRVFVLSELNMDVPVFHGYTF